MDQMKILGYLPPPLAFASLVIGMRGSSNWNPRLSGLQQVSPFGWTLVVLGLFLMISSWYLTWKSTAESAVAERQRQAVRDVAHDDLRLALKELTWPFFNIFNEWDEANMFTLVPCAVRKKESIEYLDSLSIRDWHNVGGEPGDVLWQVIERQALEARRQVDRSLQIYSYYLEPEIIDAASSLLGSSMFHRLQTLGTHVGINKHVKDLKFHFGTKYMDDEFEEFWGRVDTLDRMIQRNEERLRKRKGIPTKDVVEASKLVGSAAS